MSACARRCANPNAYNGISQLRDNSVILILVYILSEYFRATETGVLKFDPLYKF